MDFQNNVYPHAHNDAGDHEISISLDTEMIDEEEIMAMQAQEQSNRDEDDEGEISEAMLREAPPNLMRNKVHLRGLDNMSTADVKNLVAQNYNKNYEKLEWIDDTSLNIVFESDAVASDALVAMTADGVVQVPYWDLREARRSDSHPMARLEVRIARDTDKKEKGARERSRYYLFNPEEDRLEKKQRARGDDRRGRGNGYRERDYARNQRQGSSEEGSDYNRRYYDAGEEIRRNERSTYTENMYDDDTAATKKEPIELFPDGVRGGSRARTSTRSKSPMELFPAKINNTGLELFPEKVTANSRARRRSASPSEYRLPTPPRTVLSYEQPEGPPRRGQSPPGVNIRGQGHGNFLDSRIELFPDRFSSKKTQPVVAKKTFEERLGFGNHEYIEQEDNMQVEPSISSGGGFSIRGSSATKGFSIRGAAANGSAGDLILDKPKNAGVELLPSRTSNDLFSRIEGVKDAPRQNNRRRAHDMFG